MIEWFQSNWLQITAVVLAVDGLFFAITKLTPTVKDDNIYAIVHTWILKFFRKTP